MKKEETKKVNNDFDKSFGVINNLVNKEFKNCIERQPGREARARIPL